MAGWLHWALGRLGGVILGVYGVGCLESLRVRAFHTVYFLCCFFVRYVVVVMVIYVCYPFSSEYPSYYLSKLAFGRSYGVMEKEVRRKDRIVSNGWLYRHRIQVQFIS